MERLLTEIKGRSKSIVRIEGFMVLLLVNIMLGLSYSFVVPFNSIFGIDEVGMSNTAFGVFMAISAVVGVVIVTYIGKLSDQLPNQKMILLVCAVAGTIGYAGFAFVRNYYVLLVISSFILGIASSSFYQISAYAREMVTKSDLPAKEVPFYMNTFRVFFSLSWTVGPAIGSVLLLKLGFRGLFLGAAICYLLIVLIVLVFFKKNGRVGEAVSPKAVLPLKQIVLRPYIFINLIVFTLIFAAQTIATINMSQFVTKTLGSGEEQVGIIFSIPTLFEIPLMLGFGVLAVSMGSKQLITIGALLSFLYFSALYFVTEPWHIYPIQIISAACIAITQGNAISYFQDFIPTMPGTGTALYMITSRVGSTVGFLLFGVLSDAFGYRDVFLCCSLFTGVSLLLLVLFNREKRALESAG
ncbi:sugar efflux transporter [Paenibacillus solisilvae]|uniref:Sugar efflux transporter n=1 Tax=Paenibacillus solisilvae TaxID=2486751 RepID=A0ABW0W1F6_9BACL